MEAFECAVGTKKRDVVNRMPLKKHLVNPWLVGTVSALCAKHHYRSKEEWKAVYLESGTERNRLIALLPKEEQNIALSPKCPENIWTTYPHIAALNFHYGRTREQLNFFGNQLFEEAENKPNLKEIERRDARYLIKHFVVEEAWNDMQLRKHNTSTQLQTILQNQALSVEVQRLDSMTGALYAVDAEIYVAGVLKCAVLIKPLDYKKSFIVTEEAKNHNQEKNDRYKREKDVPVFCVLAKKDGTCFNPEIIAKITTACRQKEGQLT